MALVHRQDDLRVCGATTIVVGQSTVYAGGKLISVVGDPNSHIGGHFLGNGRTVLINGNRVIGVGDTASGDNAFHPPPPTDAATGIATIFIG